MQGRKCPRRALACDVLRTSSSRAEPSSFTCRPRADWGPPPARLSVGSEMKVTVSMAQTAYGVEPHRRARNGVPRGRGWSLHVPPEKRFDTGDRDTGDRHPEKRSDTGGLPDVGIGHATIQIEVEGCEADDTYCMMRPLAGGYGVPYPFLHTPRRRVCFILPSLRSLPSAKPRSSALCSCIGATQRLWAFCLQKSKSIGLVRETLVRRHGDRADQRVHRGGTPWQRDKEIRRKGDKG